jgi:nucleotide-binding universal stress UspA family protein
MRVLVGVDFSPESLRALGRARELARATGGPLTVVHVRPTSDVRAAVQEERGDLLRFSASTLRKMLREHYAARLAALRDSSRTETTRLLRGHPAEVLCREAARGYDILVLASRGRGDVARLVLGSTVQEALARSRVPVLVVR